MIRTAIAAALILGPGAAFAQETGPQPHLPSAPPATVTAGDETVDSEKVICRHANPPTGTRIRGRGRQQMCMTKADWDLLADEAQAAHRDMDNPSRNEEFLGGSGS